MVSRLDFYTRVLSEQITDRSASVLVVAAGENDRDVFVSCGFSDVTISNLDVRMAPEAVAPYRWSRQDAERLTFDDDSFDYVVVHAGLHHCRSPHGALLEMYRVARRGVLFFEARDSTTMKLLQRLGMTQTYEHAAVFYNGGTFGGVANSDVPNFIYRWTENEVRKTIQAFAPAAVHRFVFHYGSSPPATPGVQRRSLVKRATIAAARPLYGLFALVFPKQQNLFGVFIAKPRLPGDLQPWMTMVDGRVRFDNAWGARVYREGPLP